MQKTIFILLFLMEAALFSQTNYLIKLTNPNQTSNNSLEFDINIKSTGSDFVLSSYQCTFSIDLPITNNDSIYFNYIDSTSELSNFPINVIGYDTTDGLGEIIFVSGIGNDIISDTEKLVGRFMIYSSIDFSLDELNLMWNFSGTANTILTGDNFSDITKPENHLNFDNGITDVSDVGTIREQFELSQNYPNPFNPSTTISYTIPTIDNGKKISNVTLKIYDILGREVITLVDQNQRPGNYEIKFKASSIASGTYFYELRSGNFRSLKKMILLK